MKVLVTGSSGHLGEALIRTHRLRGNTAIGVDIKPSPSTDVVGSIADPEVMEGLMDGVQAVFHTATLHKPHVATHSKAQFVETNVSGTLVLLEAAQKAGVEAFVFTSTTSVFGDAMRPATGDPAAWISEEVTPRVKNIYGATKLAAEDLCVLFHRNNNMNIIVLRTSRFFPEDDDNREQRDAFAGNNLKINEYLYRRVELEDVVGAHLQAAKRAPEIGFGRFIISATSPFKPSDLAQLRQDAPAVVERLYPDYAAVFARHNYSMLPGIDRVYVNKLARETLGWEPKYSFQGILDRLRTGTFSGSELANQVGSKGYHEEVFTDGPYPTE